MNKIKRFLRDKGIAFKVPFQNLSENDRQLILYGDEDGDGIISYLEKRMKAAESWWEMDEVARFMATRNCPLVRAIDSSRKSFGKIQINQLAIFLDIYR